MPERFIGSRRDVIKYGLAVGIAPSLIFSSEAASKSATPVAESEPKGYSLTLVGDELVDKELFLNGEKGIQSLEFSFDKDVSGGSLEVRFCTNNPDDVTLLLREVKPNKGYLYNAVLSVDTSCVNKYPAPYFEVNDVEEVLIGQGTDEKGNYKDMRLYRITRGEKGLKGDFKGLETVDPTKIKMRDEGVASG